MRVHLSCRIASCRPHKKNCHLRTRPVTSPCSLTHTTPTSDFESDSEHEAAIGPLSPRLTSRPPHTPQPNVMCHHPVTRSRPKLALSPSPAALSQPSSSTSTSVLRLFQLQTMPNLPHNAYPTQILACCRKMIMSLFA